MQTPEEKEQIIDEILSRSISTILPSREAFKKLLLSGKKLKIYIGADATGPTLHLGHSTNFILLEKLRKLGHQTILLFGDFTAMIGDPTDKSATRVALTPKQVKENISTWKKQLSPIVKLSGIQKTKVVKNSAWLKKLSFADVVRLSSNFTVQQMLERDMFEKRIKENKPVHLHEFLYPLMQGYDSVALDVDVEIGGTDQTFNMLAGRTLQKKFRDKEKFVITTTLLEDPKTGKKLMSKSEGGFVGLSDSPQDMFGKIMALSDESIPQLFIDCTFVSLEKINSYKEALLSGTNPRDIKLILAEEICSLYHGKEKSVKSKNSFIQMFSEKNVNDSDFIKVKAKEGSFLSDVVIGAKIISSKSEFTRLIKENGVANITTSSQKVTDTKQTVSIGEKYKIGKHRFIKIEE